MSRPDTIPFQSFIHLDKIDSTPLYLQLVFEFIKAIQMGFLPAKTKLPGTRLISVALEVNRNTLIKAFQDLELQGWVEIVPNKGIYILSKTKSAGISSANISNTNKNGIPFSFLVSTLLTNPDDFSALTYQFNDGKLDLKLQQTDVLARLYVSGLKKQQLVSSNASDSIINHQLFKKHFANFLNITRSLRIATDELLTVLNHEQSLFLVCKVLLSQDDIVLIAGKGYYKSTMVISATGATIVTIPIDEYGIDTKAIESLCQTKNVRMLYLTSNFHYPENRALQASRKIEILNLAATYRFIILEDDYEFDFHHDHHPVAPLKHMDHNNSVIYVGSLSRFLPAGFNYGFVVAHQEIVKEVQKHQNMLEPEKDSLKEAVLTSWIKEGEIHRLNKKNKKIYHQRRNDFVNLLKIHLGDKIRFVVPTRGLSVWVEFNDEFNLMQLKARCAANGLHLPKTILYQDKYGTALRLGYAHLKVNEMEIALKKLKLSLTEILNHD